MIKFKVNSFFHRLKVWDTSTGKELLTLTGNSSSIDAVAITPTGEFICGSKSNTYKVWNISTGKEIATLIF